ncbi:hypothetical protein EMPS_06553 [Entomortierella parvispora]|uniref:Uncharacterized protein n=1 Tax=Entomortierella parvispora TaxID=205924 RepID=A0A9P3HCU3_9FUNG|nr:hypothetical protein EMPS_06553 [Entomortierella parvispora]
MESSSGQSHSGGHSNNNRDNVSEQSTIDDHAHGDASDWETEASGTEVESTTGDIVPEEETSEWETEDSGDDGDNDMDEDAEFFSDDDEDFDAWEDAEGNPIPGQLWDDDDDNAINIEALTPAFRANRRPDMIDIMSEFSGDEKYEPKRELTANDGEGEVDMFDRLRVEQFDPSEFEIGHLTAKIRQLMLHLKTGRKNRERKLGIKRDDTHEPYYNFSTESRQGLSPLIVRGPGHPQEVEHSPAISFHQQCANSLTVSPSAMGLWDDLYTINQDMILRCGVLPRMTDLTFTLRMNASVDLDERYDERVMEEVFRPYARELMTVPATKFLPISIYKFDELPQSEAYVEVGIEDDPLCIAHRYGYLAHGTSDGNLVAYCTDCGGEPIEIHNDTIPGQPDDMMLNSIQIVRWPRFYRSKMHQDEDGMDVDGSEDGDDDEDEYDLKEGYPTQSGQFDHYMVMTGNEYGLFIAALPDHPCLARRQASKWHGEVDMFEHIFKYKEDHTWIKKGFHGERLNDAKVSPNGRWIVIVGDSARVFTMDITHVAETEEQRIAREEREQELELKDLDTDSEYYNSDDSMEAVEQKLGLSDNARDSLRSKDQATPTMARKRDPPRLLHQFGPPQEHAIPDRVIFGTHNKRRRVVNNNYTSQYVAWNASSTKFAHTSDTTSKVMVWSMPSREIVCCVDTGGFSYAIEFHPKLENVFAVNNWYGFVHVVDITGCCIGDQDLVPDVELNSRGPTGGGCTGPHYEEKHDILMCSFRGEKDKSLRILDGLRGLGWSTDGRYLYVSTLRRVLRYEFKDDRIRIPSLFDLCARQVRQWKERTLSQEDSGESDASIKRSFGAIAKDWEYVPYLIKRRIWGDLFLMQSHNE